MNIRRVDSATAVAVTGMACRFPGAPDVRSFWRNLCASVVAIRRIEHTELRRAGVPEDLLLNSSFVPACAPIPEPYAFDAAHFGIAPTTARSLDLQHRVFLECAWTALEASGTLAAGRSAVAVFAGCSDTTCQALPESWDEGQAGTLAASLGSSSDFLAARVAFLLNLRGPAITVRAACATSLVAVHLAVQSLLSNECDVAVAGGAAIRYPLMRGHLYEPGGIYSSDGLCRPYDHLGSGIVSGDGAGAVVLRRLSDALADGDYVHAVICGSAVTNDGARKASFTAPSVEGQVEAALNALEVADIDPATIGFVEGHGTATPLGDPLEVEALKRVWETGTRSSKPCILGAVKSAIGHLDAAAGIAGFIKACLAIEHGRIPGTLNYTAPNPNSGLTDSPFLVSARALDWNRPDPRRASVHSLGLGGVNAHVVLEQAPPANGGHSITVPSVPVVLTLSTRRPEAMGIYAEALAAEFTTLGRDEATAARTLQFGRVPESYRRAVVGNDRETLSRRLLSPNPPVRVATGRPRLVLVFSGDGKRIQGGLSQLAKHFPSVSTTMQTAAAHLRSRWGIDLFEVIQAVERSPRGIIPAIVAQGISLHAALDQFGAGGDLVLGQSLGELTAAVASGLIDIREALDLAMAREQTFRAVAPSGALAVGLAPGILVKRLPFSLELSLVNSPNRCVVSGKTDALALFAAELEADDVPVQRLELISAVHSSLLDPVLDCFRSAAEQLKPRSPRRTFLSSVGPSQVDEMVAANPEHWTRQLRETVSFDACLRAAISGQNETIMVDVGPGGGLTTSMQETVGGEVRDIVRLSPVAEDVSEIEAFALALGKLWEHGLPINWDAWPRRTPHRTSLPVPSLAATVHEPNGTATRSTSVTSRSNAVTLWTRNWRKTRLTPDNQVLRILILAGSDPFCHEVGGWLTRLGHHVQVNAQLAWPEGRDQADLVLDGRSLGESDGPAAIAPFLEIAAAASRQPGSSRLVVLTRCAFDIVGTEMLSPSGAAMAAAALVLAQEYGNIDVTCVDLASGAMDAEMVARMLASKPERNVWLGLRGRTWWHPIFESITCRVESRSPIPTSGPCVIIGGLGRFGRWIGRWLAQHGCRELFLVSRSGVLSASSSNAVAAMQQAGCEVKLVQADVTNRTAIFQVLDDARRSAGGAITIFHLAGQPHAASACAPVVDLARGDLRSALEEQWVAKVVGGLRLLEWTRLHPEARCLTFSSNAAVLGGPGLAAYAAANAALDALAISARDHEGLHWCSIGWDGWRLPDDEPDSTPTTLESFALRGMEPWVALQEAVAAGLGHVVVAKGDFIERHRTWVVEPSRDASDSCRYSSPNTSLASATDMHDDVATVRRIWSETLGFMPDDDADLFNVGGDSLTAMRIRSRIERALGAHLTLREVLQNRTVSGLVKLIRERIKSETGSHREAAVSHPTAPDRTIHGRV